MQCLLILITEDNKERITMTTDNTNRSIEIRLTPTKLEQLEAIRDYQRQSYSINSEEQSLEEVARQLLYDVIRAKYNSIKERI